MLFTWKRKKEQLKICLSRNQEELSSNKTNGFERYDFTNNSLPELGLDSLNIGTEFLGKRLEAPLIISSMVGGTEESEKINKNLAKAAQEVGIGMGVGSQRAMIEKPELTRTYRVREETPDILLFGNIGITQLARKHFSTKQIIESIKMIQADGLCVHLNAVHEMCQPDGDRDFRNGTEALEKLVQEVDFPVIAKETGAGISSRVARMLEQTGVSAIDVGGAGGTSWLRIEGYRGSLTGSDFRDWGIPTSESLVQVRKAVKIPIIATGGIRDGLDVAKAIALGADVCGIAFPLLKPALRNYKGVVGCLNRIIESLKVVMIGTGAKRLSELKVKRFT